LLKPSELGVTGVKRPISQHKLIVANSLLRLLRIRGPQARVAEVCLSIMESPNGSIIDVSRLTGTDFTEIKNYFAEVMGPIWCHEQGLLPGIKSHDHTYFEPSQNQLYDFKVYKNDEPFLISNKRKIGVTNTIKPSDLIRLVDRNADLARKWRSSQPYHAMRILDDSSVVSGPIKVMSRVYPYRLPIPEQDYHNVIRQLTRNDIELNDVPNSIMSLIDQDATAAAMYENTQVVTGTMINFIFEKILIDISKNDPQYNDMYVEATNGNIYILKFDLDTKGNMYFNIEDPATNDKMAVFRSKQGIERRDMTGKLKLDKLGLTV
jgi:hypothetical protein